MRPIAATLLFAAVAACAPVSDTDPIAVEPEISWASAFAPYKNCTLELTYWAQHSDTPAAIDRFEYDANGVWTHNEYYDILYSDGDLVYAIDRQIDALGREQSARWTDIEGDTTIETTTTWDEVGPVSRVATSPIGLISERHWTIEHDAAGRSLVESADDAPFDGEPEVVRTSEWDGEGRGRGSQADLWLADRSTEEVAGEPTEVRIRTFDDQGRWVHLDGVDYTRGAQSWQMDVEYDEAGRESSLISACDADCWWWEYQENTYAWTCP